MLHMASVMPIKKMDTPDGLFKGTCSCSWVSEGIENEAGAKKAAREHADAKNTELAPDQDWTVVTLYNPELEVMLTLRDHPAMNFTYTFSSQSPQFPETGEPGLSYFAGVMDQYDVPVDCILYRNERGRLVGIGYHYPIDYAGMEQAGNIFVLTHPKYVRKGVAGKVLAELDKQYHVNFAQQKYSRQGLALVTAYLMKRGYEIVED